MAVMLTDQKFELHPGEGLIMNAGQLHRVIPRQQKSGILVCLNLSPSALGLRSGSYMDRNLLSPIQKSGIYGRPSSSPHSLVQETDG